MENLEEITKRIDRNETKIDKLNEVILSLKEKMNKSELELGQTQENVNELKKTYEVIGSLNTTMIVLSEKIENLSQRLLKIETDNNISVLGTSKDVIVKIIIIILSSIAGLVLGKGLM